MSTNFKKTYKFAAYTSAAITIVLTLALGVFSYVQGSIDFLFLAGFFIVCYLLCFFVVQQRVEKFIYRKIQNIYDDVALLDATSLTPNRITTDMATLTKEVGRFAEDKKMEIEALTIKENYRKEFIGNISHELKTPLFTVQGYILTLIDGAMHDKSVRKKYLQRANKGVERLIYIVKDLDMITKLESGILHLEPKVFDIRELIKNVFDLLEMRATKESITLTLDREYRDPILVRADRERIQQVVSNLLVNSIKYGRKGGTTEVSIEDLINNKVIIRVSDNGEGIASQHLERVFERFYRIDKSGSRKDGGSGLGLAIVKHIIEAHDEKIYVESQPGIGSEFSFTLEKPK